MKGDIYFTQYSFIFTFVVIFESVCKYYFKIRIRKNTLLDDGQKELRADVCFQDLQVGQSKVLSKPRTVWNHWLRIAAMRLKDGDLLIVATAHDPESVFEKLSEAFEENLNHANIEKSLRSFR